MTNGIRYDAISDWAVDFIRAVRERPLLLRLLFRFVIGKYAYREFIGLMDDLERSGFSPYFDYGLEATDYHEDAIPCMDWWSERVPTPLKAGKYVS